MVNVLILFRQHNVPVQHQHPAEFVGIKHFNLLVIAFAGVQLLLDMNGKPHIIRVLLCKPKCHSHPSCYLTTLMRDTDISSVPVIKQPFSLE